LALLIHGRREGTAEHEGPIGIHHTISAFGPWMARSHNHGRLAALQNGRPAGPGARGRMHRWIGWGHGHASERRFRWTSVFHRTKIRSFHGSKARVLIPATNLVWRSDVRVTRHGMCRQPQRAACAACPVTVRGRGAGRHMSRRPARPPRLGWVDGVLAGCWVGKGAG
jgi:hypothetical protein